MLMRDLFAVANLDIYFYPMHDILAILHVFFVQS